MRWMRIFEFKTRLICGLPISYCFFVFCVVILFSSLTLNFVSFCLQTNYMQSITFVLIASRRWLLLFSLVRFCSVPGSHSWCSLSISIRICLCNDIYAIYTGIELSALSRFCWTGNLWLYNQYFSSFISCGFWSFLFFLVCLMVQWLLSCPGFFYEIWIACTNCAQVKIIAREKEWEKKTKRKKKVDEERERKKVHQQFKHHSSEQMNSIQLNWFNKWWAFIYRVRLL